MRSKRGSERGAAVFVVVLVIAMLTGIGMFAARSASVATITSGFDRQINQTHYIAEYGTLAVVDELSSQRRSWYLNEMVNSDPTCTQIATGYTAAVQNKTCYKFGYGDLEQSLLANTNNTFVETGGLGPADPLANFVIEMSDRAPASESVPGMAKSGDQGQVSLKFWNVTLTGTGQVRPRPANYDPTSTTVVTESASSATNESVRFHLTVGPI